MRIFLASSWLNKHNAEQASRMLENAGYSIVLKWWNSPDPVLMSTEKRNIVLREDAIHDVEALHQCDILVLLWPGRLGSAGELGAVLALNKPAILVGGIPRLDWVYANHPLVTIVGTMTDAIKLLRKYGE